MLTEVAVHMLMIAQLPSVVLRKGTLGDSRRPDDAYTAVLLPWRPMPTHALVPCVTPAMRIDNWHCSIAAWWGDIAWWEGIARGRHSNVERCEE
jgi:hypothetical protein